MEKVKEFFNKIIEFFKKLISNPVLIAIGAGIVAVVSIFLKRSMSNTPPTNNNSSVTEDDVSEDNYVQPDISKEEAATESQTQTINTIIENGAAKVEDAKEDTDIKTTQDRIDKGWDEL